MIASICSRLFPKKSFFRYVGVMTTWYLHSHLKCDRLCHSRIVLSHCLEWLPRRESLFILRGSTDRSEPLLCVHGLSKEELSRGQFIAEKYNRKFQLKITVSSGGEPITKDFALKV